MTTPGIGAATPRSRPCSGCNVLGGREQGITNGSGVTYTATVFGDTVTVTMSADQGASLGDHQATLRVLSGGSEIGHAVLYTFVKQ